jgi:translation initiation factor IF-3
MSRSGALPGGIANLNDTIRVVDRDGTDLGLMIVAEAQKIASEQGGELFVTDRDAKPPVVRIVLVRKARME